MPAFIRAALIDDDHAEFRRWSYSAMLVVALHGAVATTVLSWHVSRQPFDAGGPSGVGALFIDLAPPPSPEQNLPQLDARNTPAAEPGANGPGADVPIAPLGQEGMVRDGGGTAGASHAFAADTLEKSPAEGSQVFRADPGPLDTSITVLPPLHPRKSFSAFDRNRMILLRPLTHPGKTESSSDNPNALTNAPDAHRPGAHIQDRVNAAIERGQLLRRIERARNGNTVPGTNGLGIKNATGAGVHGNASRNAIGAANANGNIGEPKADVINGTARNAIGLTVQVHPSAHGTNVNDGRGGVAGLKTGVSPSSTGLKAAALPTGILNGRGMSRPGTGLTALGGPAKSATGVLNGSDFHPKR